MEMLDTSLFKAFYQIIIALVAVIAWKGLFESAVNSLKRTGGKWSSVLDELIGALIVLAILVILIQMEPSASIGMLIKPLQWFGNLLLEFMRTVGIPV